MWMSHMSFLIVSNRRSNISHCRHLRVIITKMITLMTSKFGRGGAVLSANFFPIPGYVVIHHCYKTLVIRAGQWGLCCAGYIWYSALSDASSNTRGSMVMALATCLTLAAVALLNFSGATLADYPQSCNRYVLVILLHFR